MEKSQIVEANGRTPELSGEERMKKKKGDWVVTLEATVNKEIVVSNCTEEEAKANPWAFAVDERDLETVDWEVLDVEPNE